MKLIKRILEIVIPRFTTEDVALQRTQPGNSWECFDIVCAMDDVQEYERFDGIATVDSFVFLGIGFTYKIANFRPWSDLPSGGHGT